MKSAHDWILQWISERGSGTLADFKEAWDWLQQQASEDWHRDGANKAWIEVSDLAALGHLEISWEDKKEWSVAPPVLTMLPNSGCRALLAGARNLALVNPETLEAGAGDSLLNQVVNAGELDIYAQCLPQYRGSEKGPSAIVVAADSPETVRALADECGIGFSYSICDELSLMFPSLAKYAELWAPEPMPLGHSIEVFDVDRVRWIPCKETERFEPGLYAVKLSWDVVHILQTSPEISVHATREHGVYERMRWEDRDVLDYSEMDSELWVPTQAPLPPLQARAATLASGMLPRYERRHDMHGVVYVNISDQLASRIAKSLEQTLNR
jgi:hypothetical protein